MTAQKVAFLQGLICAFLFRVPEHGGRRAAGKPRAERPGAVAAVDPEEHQVVRGQPGPGDHLRGERRRGERPLPHAVSDEQGPLPSSHFPVRHRHVLLGTGRSGGHSQQHHQTGEGARMPVLADRGHDRLPQAEAFRRNHHHGRRIHGRFTGMHPFEIARVNSACLSRRCGIRTR